MKHADTIEYLESAIEIEVNILKLEEASRALRAEADDRANDRELEMQYIKNSQSDELNEYERELDVNIKNAEEEYKRQENFIGSMKINRLKYDFSISTLIGFILLGALVFFVFFSLSPLILKLFPSIEEATMKLGLVVGAIMAILFWIVLFVTRHILKKKLEKDINEGNAELIGLKQKIDTEVEQKNIKLDQFMADQLKASNKEKLLALKKQEEFLLSQADKNDLVLEKLYKQRMDFYSADIIPPDYRYLDCVGVLHQIFVNDLADTMRDAILLYEERVFRGDLIRGIDQINQQLEKINHNLIRMNVMLRYVCEKLTEISEQAGMMVAELSDIADKIDDNTAVNEMILGGIALQNAQTEAIKYNTKALSKLEK